MQITIPKNFLKILRIEYYNTLFTKNELPHLSFIWHLLILCLTQIIIYGNEDCYTLKLYMDLVSLSNTFII